VGAAQREARIVVADDERLRFCRLLLQAARLAHTDGDDISQSFADTIMRARGIVSEAMVNSLLRIYLLLPSSCFLFLLLPCLKMLDYVSANVYKRQAQQCCFSSAVSLSLS